MGRFGNFRYWITYYRLAGTLLLQHTRCVCEQRELESHVQNASNTSKATYH